MTSLHDSHKGAWAELQAASWLLRQGYEVCRNVSQCGPVDLVAIRRDGKMFLIDVKTQKPLVYGSGATKLTPLQQEMGVRLLFVSPRGICIWQQTFSPSRRLTGPRCARSVKAIPTTGWFVGAPPA